LALSCATLHTQSAGARPQFEVASVKPAVPNNFPPAMKEMMQSRGQPGAIPMAGLDRVRIQDWTLRNLIAAAYSVRASQVSGPDWLGDQGFDVDATVPDGTPKSRVNAMLQSLLEDRFGLKVHRATQTAQGFALVVGKDGPKLKPAAPPSASPAEQLTPEEQKAQMQQKLQADLAAAKQRNQEKLAVVGAFSTQSWASITMEDFAAQLIRFAGGPVVDKTGLSGKYSAKIETWASPDVPGGTIFDAVEKLGLKLEPSKVTVETVVVDQVSKTPTAN